MIGALLGALLLSGRGRDLRVHVDLVLDPRRASRRPSRASARGSSTGARPGGSGATCRGGEHPRHTTSGGSASATEPRGSSTAVRQFQIGFAEAELDDLRRRINATRWPERETVNDDSQGVPLATMQELARYWATDYDWRRCEAKLNALPNFMTEIDGLDIHFIHVRSRHEDALPLIVTHGWPGSIIEQLKIIEPLTDPTAHGGSAGGRVPSRDPVAAGPRVLRQADHHRLGSRRASPAPGSC